MSKDQKQVCMYCRHWACRDRHAPEAVMHAIAGDCRLSPPQLVQQSHGPGEPYAATAWPITKGGHWCGQFLDRPDDHVTEFPDFWEHISEPVDRVIENASRAYEKMNGGEDAA